MTTMFFPETARCAPVLSGHYLMLRFSVEEHCTCTTGILLGCMLTKSVNAVSGRDIMVVNLLHFFVFLRFIFVVLICCFLRLAVCMLSFWFSVWVRPTSLTSL